VDYVIPSNDDATKSIAVIMDTVSASIKEALSQRKTEKDKPGTEKLTKAAAKVAAE
jgi:small subunit ribosomal protein S2